MSAGKDVVNVLSVDVEDYFHGDAFASVDPDHWGQMEQRVADNTRRILDLFAQEGVRGTFFVLGWCAEKYPFLVEEIHRAGHEVATHGHAHTPITRQTRDEFKADVVRSRKIIEGITGERILGYRAPSFSVTRKTLWAVDILKEMGLLYDSSVFPIYHDRYGIPDSPREPYQIIPDFWELPLSSLAVGRIPLPVGGGGYLRLYPFALTRWILDRLNRGGQAVVVYFHPHEIDEKSPGAPCLAGRMRRALHTGSMIEKVARLLREFRFAPANEVLSL